MEKGLDHYKSLAGSVPESELRLSSDIMTTEQFQELDTRQEEFLIEASLAFPVLKADQDLKKFASSHLDPRFKKGDRQFCAAGSSRNGKLLWQLQDDYRLGNANTCAERFLLDEADTTGETLDSITVYRGENISITDNTLHTLKENGGENHITEKPTMRHMVGPCAYCREGVCRHNQTAMIIMPPGILSRDKTSIKLPAFLTYPQEDLFEENDPLKEKLTQSGTPELLEARIKQKEFFKEIAKKYPVTDADRALLNEAYQDLARQPATDDPYMLIRALTITNQPVEVSGIVPPPQDPKHQSYLDYPRNPVEVRFVHELLEQPPFPSSSKRRAGSPHSLHTFLELYREPGQNDPKLLLPNADTRQRMVERFQRSFILVSLDGEIVKLPLILFYPNRYKRLDKTDRV